MRGDSFTVTTVVIMSNIAGFIVTSRALIKAGNYKTDCIRSKQPTNSQKKPHLSPVSTGLPFQIWYERRVSYLLKDLHLFSSLKVTEREYNKKLLKEGI